LLLALALRLHQITYAFDGDEIFSVRAARSPIQSMIETTLWDRPHPPLYTFLLFLWVRLVGHSEAAARSLSVLLSLGTLFIFYRIGLRLIPKWGAVIAVGLATVSPFCVFYGRQARPFMLGAFLGVLSILLLLKVRENPENRLLALAYGFCCVSLLYTQYMGVALVATQLALISWLNFSQKKTLWACGGLSILSILPWMVAARRVAPSLQIEQYIGWMQVPAPFEFAFLLIQIFGEFPSQGASRFLLLALVASLSAVLIYRRQIDAKKVALIAALALCMPVAAFAASHAFSTPLWAPRHFQTSILFLFLLTALGLSLHRRLLSGTLLLFFAAWTFVTIPNALPANTNPPWRSLANLVRTEFPQHQLVVSERWVQIPLTYYLEKPVPLSDERGIGENSNHVLFLCRPRSCDRLQQLSDYRIVGERKVVWGRNKPEIDRTILVYVLNRQGTA
jgi:uncharacterized membrane protein